MKFLAFDFDGTIADSRFAICEAMERSCIRNGVTYVGDDEFSQHIGIYLNDLVQLATKEVLDEKTIKAVVESYRQTYRYNLVTLFDGVKQLLYQCRDQGDRIAIASSRNSHSLNILLEQLDVKHLANVIIGGDQVSNSKPDPEILWKVATELFCNPGELIMIGDTTWDIETALNTGAFAVGVTWGTHDEVQLRGAGADHICNRVEELQEFLDLTTV